MGGVVYAGGKNVKISDNNIASPQLHFTTSGEKTGFCTCCHSKKQF